MPWFCPFWSSDDCDSSSQMASQTRLRQYNRTTVITDMINNLDGKPSQDDIFAIASLLFSEGLLNEALYTASLAEKTADGNDYVFQASVALLRSRIYKKLGNAEKSTDALKLSRLLTESAELSHFPEDTESGKLFFERLRDASSPDFMQQLPKEEKAMPIGEGEPVILDGVVGKGGPLTEVPAAEQVQPAPGKAPAAEQMQPAPEQAPAAQQAPAAEKGFPAKTERKPSK